MTPWLPLQESKGLRIRAGTGPFLLRYRPADNTNSFPPAACYHTLIVPRAMRGCLQLTREEGSENGL
jgi:hypothetical protein